MSISKQLYFMISIAILGILSIAYIGGTKMDTVYDETNYANVNSLPSIFILNDTMQNGYRLRLNLWEHISSEDQKVMQNAENAIQKVKESIEKSFHAYEKLLSDEKDKALLIKNKEALLKVYGIIENVMKLSRENQKSQAATLLNTNRPHLLAFTNFG